MTDHLGVAERSWNMSRIRSKNTSPELAVRKALTSQGIKYRLHINNLPGKPDIVIRKTKEIVFVNGCFWHQHPNCKRSTSPKTNVGYWKPKLQGNIERQKKAITELRRKDWRVITVWECETRDEGTLSRKLQKELLT